MPIRPENRKLYPPDWKHIRARILARAGNRCECGGECGLHHDLRCIEMHGQKARYARGRIVLTIAHLDHDPTNNSDGNLKAMCQRCHNRYDIGHRSETRRRTRDSKRGQAVMEFKP